MTKTRVTKVEEIEGFLRIPLTSNQTEYPFRRGRETEKHGVDRTSEEEEISFIRLDHVRSRDSDRTPILTIDTEGRR